jgi:hypothetical protein
MVGELPPGYNPFAVGAVMANGQPAKGLCGGILPNADCSGGFQLMVLGVGKNPLNTPLAAFIAGGGYGRKPGQQALIAKIGADIVAYAQQASQQALAARVQPSGIDANMPIQSGLPRDLGTNNGGNGGRNV